ncbi:hypothetical protein MKW94_006793 [Papaver nudicaule]|uniref:Uncharacterized protein n=1 Tax=Papaver nudicaule TaxID=74823 RepID=A0AA41VM92_PAPNU|nr:hypothetical protein [Papaver nudicaule]
MAKSELCAEGKAVIADWEEIEKEEERRKAKIRWLLGIPDGSTSAPPPLNNKCMPESLLREDDVSFENVRTSVEKCFGIPSHRRDGFVVHSFLFLLDSKDILQDVKKCLPSIIKSMNCMGLLQFANTVTGGSISFEKTRIEMTKIILEYLKKIPRSPADEDYKRFIEELPELLKNPCHFQETSWVQFVDPAFICLRSAARKLLEGLENMDLRTLDAMNRRLKGKVKEPEFPCKVGHSDRVDVLKTVKRRCDTLLSKGSEGDQVPPALAKAMSVVVLIHKIKLNDPKISMPEFCRFSNTTNVIHRDLLKSIKILEVSKLSDSVIKKLRSVLDPESKVDKLRFRKAIQTWLIEYLFECSEITEIPESVLKTSDIINRIDSSISAPAISIEKEKAKEEVENVLALSGQLKQILLDNMSDHTMDEEFDDAYFEHTQLYSGEEYSDLFDHPGSHSDDESVGECETDGSVLAENGENASTLSNEGTDNEQKPVNKYLVIQEICDETSLFAHQLIGRSLAKLLDEEGVELEESKRLYLRETCNQEVCANIKNKKTCLNGASPNPGDSVDAKTKSKRGGLAKSAARPRIKRKRS